MQTTHLARLPRIARNKILWSLAAAAFWVVALWGYWDRGTYALGLNAFAYLAVTSALFLYGLTRRGVKLRGQMHWIAPLGMIAAGFLLYDIPFLKQWHYFVFLAAFGFFVNLAMAENGAHARWGDAVVTRLVIRCFSFFDGIAESARRHARLLSYGRGGNDRAKRIVLGSFLFFALAVSVVIPLLAAADADFARQVRVVTDWIAKAVSMTTVAKVLFAGALSVTVTAAAVAWLRPHSLPDAGERKDLDSIVMGIVVGGTLGIYLLFLAVQAKRLFAGALPFDFRAVETFVKSGFWQLFALTCLNLLIYVSAYRRTSSGVQKLLGAFAGASLLLLASAAQRVGLYVTYYGFSYEKFFASYVVLYCAILIGWLIWRSVAKGRADVARFAVLLFLWMYGVASVFPVEQFILRANVALAKRPDSQIRLYELTMLSPDVLGTVRGFKSQGLLVESAERLARESAAARGADVAAETAKGWDAWIERNQRIVDGKRWYEYVLSNVF